MAKHKHKFRNIQAQISKKSKTSKPSFFKHFKTEIITAAIIFIITGIVTWKLVQSSNNPGSITYSTSSQKTGLPKMIDLGTTTCTPCKMMIPVMEALRTEFEGRMIVEFINTAENPDAAQKYAISVIPTQIFYDKNGNELTRHTGYIAKEDVIKTFNDYGVIID